MSLIDRRTVCVLTTILLFAAVAAFIYGAHETLIVFLFAIFFAYLLHPLVALAERTRIGRGSRSRAILAVYVVLLASLTLLFYLIGPKLVSETRRLGQELPGLLNNVSNGHIAQQIGSSRGWSYETQVRVQHFLASHQDAILNAAKSVGARAAGIAKNVIWLVLIPILAIFFLKDGQSFAESLIDQADRRTKRQFLRGVIEDLHLMLAAYIRAQVLLAVISIVVYTAVLSAMRVPYAIIMGVLGGIMEFVPVVGPLVAAVTIAGIAVLTNSHVIWVVAFLGVWRLIQDYVNSPRIMGSRIEMHPLAVLFGVLVGGEIAGVVGVYLSIPAMAALRILWRRWQRYTQAQARGADVKPQDVKAA